MYKKHMCHAIMYNSTLGLFQVASDVCCAHQGDCINEVVSQK